MPEETKYLYGPVPSRRLGRSLGVDIVPAKVCTLDCVYCQLGRTPQKTVERRDYPPVEAVLAEVRDSVAKGLEADFVTVSGSGEPTLNAGLGRIVEGIKQITDIPVAVLTNGTLLHDKSVRMDCAKADLVLPSLDAGDEQTFQKVNRPHPHISFEKLITGLSVFRGEFAGQIWLEVFLIDGLNTDAEQIAKIKGAIERIRPDKVQLNTAVRPTAEPGVKELDPERLQAIATRLGPACEVVADFSPDRCGRLDERTAEDVLSMLKRRPCSLEDICSGLGIHRHQALKYVTHFQQQGVIDAERKGATTYFKASS